MKVIFGILAAAAGMASAASNAEPLKVGLHSFTANGNQYDGENHTVAKRNGGSIFEKRCSCGTTCYGVGNACVIGNCECGGQEGCYSCNGGPPVCQATNADGTPTTCAQ